MKKKIIQKIQPNKIKVYVDNDIFTVYKTKQDTSEAFAVIRDNREITIISKNPLHGKTEILDSETGWKLLTFDAVLPFSMTGFIAKITTALAEGCIPVFVLSAYSTDHILIKNENLEKTLNILIDLGFTADRR